jgi:hypothetical protein
MASPLGRGTIGGSPASVSWEVVIMGVVGVLIACDAT